MKRMNEDDTEPNDDVEEDEKEEKIYQKLPSEGPGIFFKARLVEQLKGEALKIVDAIQKKQNWHEKIMDLEIAQKYRKEALDQGAITSDVDAAFSHLLGLIVSGNVRNLLTFPNEDDKDWNEDDEDFQGGEDEDVGDSCDCRIRYVDKYVPDNLRDKLENELDKIANAPVKDFHPNTKDMIQDLIHPSLFPYIRGVSLGHDGQPYYSQEYIKKQQPPPPPSQTQQPPTSKQKNPDDDPNNEEDANEEDNVEENEDEDGGDVSYDNDFESRGLDGHQEKLYKQQIEEIEGMDSIYQWLPAEFHVDSAGLVTLRSYINNLPVENKHLEKTICSIFRLFVPLFEDVLNVSLLSQNLQVIVKAANYVLKPGQEYEGAWHIEGMKHEHIVASGIYYYSMTNNLEGNSLAFRERRSNDMDERERVHNWNFNKNIGRVNTLLDRCLVFQNTLQHKVKRLSNTSDKLAIRKILCFFLVDPQHQIVSSINITNQLWDESIITSIINQATTQLIGKLLPTDAMKTLLSHTKWGFTPEEAKQHRLQLMQERKYFQDGNNKLWERMFSFCEH